MKQIIYTLVATVTALAFSTGMRAENGHSTFNIQLSDLWNDQPAPVELPGLRNVVSFGPYLLSGSTPDVPLGLETLRSLGVGRIISVDGSKPAWEEARSHDITYVHLPIGYDGITRKRRLEVARAVQVAREANPRAPVYIHCHHGKHRSASAAAVVAVTLGWLSASVAEKKMEICGTSPRYSGLYRAVSDVSADDKYDLASIEVEFPSAWTPSTMVKAMVEIEHRFDHLRQIERAGWNTPVDHPDLVPMAEAGNLAEIFRALAKSDGMVNRPVAFRDAIRQAVARSSQLEVALSKRLSSPRELSNMLETIASSCMACHQRFRD